MKTYSCDLPMSPVSMKNSRVWTGTRSIKSPGAAAFMKSAVPLMASGAKDRPVFPLKTRLDVKVTAWYPDMRRDLDVEIVYDCLQKAGVIDNDRWIVKKVALRHPDPGERCIVEVREAVPF